MPKPNKTGGVVKTDQKKPSQYNIAGTSRATYANEPNEYDWIHNDEQYKDEPARQCSAEDSSHKHCIKCDTKYSRYKSECPECGELEFYFKRCTNCAEPTKATCTSHGANTKMTKEHSDKCKAASVTTGLTVASILFCTKTCILYTTCIYKDQLVDVDRYGSSIPRCLPEQAMYDSYMNAFRTEYELDDVADQIMLDSLVMSIVRRERGRKITAANGELVERVRTSPDGSYESWMEANPISGIIDALDKRTQAWLKELAVSKAAREGRKVNIVGNINLTNLLSNPSNATIIEQDQIIDVDLDD